MLRAGPSLCEAGYQLVQARRGRITASGDWAREMLPIRRMAHRKPLVKTTRFTRGLRVLILVTVLLTDS